MQPDSLSCTWFYILSGVLFLYIVFDGFDLGIGILTLFSRNSRVHQEGMEALHGVWHANQTWLIVFAAGLLAVFPLVYGVVMAALYIPVALMLLGLVGRGIALEYRYFFADDSRWILLAFGFGSLLAAAAQGLGIGALLSGFPVEDNHFSGGVWHWFSPLPLLFGVALPVLYLLLGATRMMGLTKGDVQGFCRQVSTRAAVAALAAVVVVLVWSLIQRPVWTEKWFSWPGILASLLPLLVGALMFVPLFYSTLKIWEQRPFTWVVISIGLLFLGMANSFYPHILPPDTSIAQAAAPSLVQTVTLVGFGVVIPLIFVYIFYMYRIFGGNTHTGE